jgi:DeoR family fructose operon transcriptional repressor
MGEPDKLLQPERLRRIQELLEKHQTVKVSELSKDFHVSENTVRRDLAQLEEAGICFRTKGGAALLKPGSSQVMFSRRLGYNREAKSSMARTASSFVSSGDTIILDSGTTAYEVALKLREKEHITVITSSLEAANVLAGLPELTVILSGGILHDTSRSTIGPPAEDFFDSVHADTLFLTVKALSVEEGLTDHTMAEASVKRRMLSCAERVVVLADHTKLGRTALTRIATLDVIDALITDDMADPQMLEALRRREIQVIVAD